MIQIDQVTGMLDSGRLHKLTGISDRTLRDWLSKGIIPRTNDLSVAIRAILAHKDQEIEQIKERYSDDEGPLYAERVRLTSAQAQKVEQENRLRAGELIEAASVARVWSSYLESAGAVLDNIPVRLAAELAHLEEPSEIEAVLRRATDEVRQNLGGREFVSGLAIAAGYDLDSAATTQADGERVGG